MTSWICGGKDNTSSVMALREIGHATFPSGFFRGENLPPAAFRFA